MVIDESEVELGRRARSGDADAFADLVALHRGAALRVATVVLGTSQGADDVVQDATVRVWRSIGSLDPERGFRSWYLRSVANTARNECRSRARRASVVARAGALREPPADRPDDAAVEAESRQDVRDALAALDPADRAVLTLRHVDDLSEAETAAALDWPLGTVKSRSSRALGRLRLAMGVALAVLVLGAAIATIGPFRRAMAHWFGIGSTTIVVDLSAAATTVAPPLPTSTLPSLSDISETTGAAAAAVLSPLPLDVVSGTELGEPSAYAVPQLLADGDPGDPGLLVSWDEGTTMLWMRGGPTAGTEMRLTKLLGAGAGVTPVDDLGDQAILVTGEHVVITPGPEVRAGTVLLWIDGPVELRLESDLPASRMLRIARQLDQAQPPA